MAEHNTLTGSSLHEPKGVASAAVQTIYVADGAGSGDWVLPPTASHGEMVVESYNTSFIVTGAIDPTLNTDTDYTKITGTGMWAAGHLDKVTFNVDELIVPVDGEYEIYFWVSLEVGTTNTLVSIKFAIDDSAPYSTRKLLSRSKVVSDINTMSGFGYVTGLTAGQTISLYIAADTTCNVIGREAGFTVKLLEAS